MSARRRIEVVEFNEEWAKLFEQEVERLRNVFGSSYVTSHHIGSTSVPGLHSKPTIDIALEVSQGTSIESFHLEMEGIGYTCRGECLDAVIPGIPGRFYFVRYDGPVHLVHTHVYETSHPDIQEKLILRDYLRANTEIAFAYGQLKKELATKYVHDNTEYIRGKDEFLKRIIADAVVWNRSRQTTCK